MCLILSILALVFSYNYFITENYLAATGAFIVGLGFMFLMIRNIMHVRKLKQKKKNDN